MRNPIEDTIPEQALPRAIKELERELAALKHNQAPTTLITDFATISFSIPALTTEPDIPGFINTKRSHRQTIRAILTPPQQQVLMAVPEFSVYHFDGFSADPWGDHFPDGDVWQSSGKWQYRNILEVSWWFSRLESDEKNLVAYIDIARHDYGGNYNVAYTNVSPPYPPPDSNPNGTTPNALLLYFFLRWRFILPGANM